MRTRGRCPVYLHPPDAGSGVSIRDCLPHTFAFFLSIVAYGDWDLSFFFFFWTNIGGGRSLPRLVHAFRDLTGSRVKFHSRRHSVLAFVAETRIVGEDRGGKIYIFREIRIDLEKIEEIFFRLTLFLKSFFF